MTMSAWHGPLIDIKQVRPGAPIQVDDVLGRPDGFWRVTAAVEVDGDWYVDAVNAAGDVLWNEAVKP